jgi:hypothetical protein
MKEGIQMRRFRQTERFIPTGYVLAKHDDYTQIDVYTFYRDGRFIALTFKGKSMKAIDHIGYKTEQARTDAINLYIKRNTKFLDDKKEFKAAQKIKNAEATQNVQVGDIFVASWGYSMSLNNAYQVIAKKGAKVTIREIATQYVSGDWTGGRVRAVKDAFISNCKEFNKILKGDTIKISDCQWANKRSEQDTFYESHLD